MYKRQALVFLPSLWNGSTNFDDPQYVFENPDVHKNNIKAFWTEAYVGTYLPLTMMTYGVEYQLAGDNPQLYHFTNLFLHLINTLLVCLLMHFLIGRIEFVVIVGLLFGIHPQHVESVAWIAERKDVLYAMFFLASAICYVVFVKKGEEKRFYFAALLLFLLSILSKAQAVVLPVVLVLFDFLLGKKWLSKRMLLNKLPFFLLALAGGAWAIYIQKSSGAVQDFELSLIHI